MNGPYKDGVYFDGKYLVVLPPMIHSTWNKSLAQTGPTQGMEGNGDMSRYDHNVKVRYFNLNI
jgi:hypothetical protein